MILKNYRKLKFLDEDDALDAKDFDSVRFATMIKLVLIRNS